MFVKIFPRFKIFLIGTNLQENMILVLMNQWRHYAVIITRLQKSIQIKRYVMILFFFILFKIFREDVLIINFSKFQKKGTANVNKDFNPRCSRSHLKHILQKCYNKSVSDPNLLNHYEAFTPEVILIFFFFNKKFSKSRQINNNSNIGYFSYTGLW